MKYFLYIITILFCSFNGIAQIRLELKPQVGFRFNCITSISNKMDMKMGGISKLVDTRNKYYYHGIVQHINDKKEMTIEFTIDSNIIYIKEGKKEDFINSNQPKTYENKKGVAEKLEKNNTPFIVHVKSNGELIKTEEEEIPQVVQFCFMKYADKPIAINETWGMETSTADYGITTKTTNTLLSVADGVAVYESSELNPAAGENPIITKVYCDVNTGFVQSYTSKATIEMMGKMEMEVMHNASW